MDLGAQELGFRPARNVSGVGFARALQMLMGVQIYVGFCHGPCQALKAKAQGERGAWRGGVGCRAAVGAACTPSASGTWPGTIIGLGTWRKTGIARYF